MQENTCNHSRMVDLQQIVYVYTIAYFYFTHQCAFVRDFEKQNEDKARDD